MCVWKSVTHNCIKPIHVQRLIVIHLTTKLVIINYSVTIVLISSLVTNPSILVSILIFFLQQLTRISYTFRRIHHVNASIRITRPTRQRSSKTITNRRRPHLPFFRGNHDHTVSCTRTIKSGCCRIFQHVNLLYILWIQTRNCISQQIHKIQIIQLIRIHIYRILLNNTVNHPQRLLRT